MENKYLNSQERFYRCMHFMPVDHVVDMEFGYWDEIHLLWQREGLPPGLDTHEKLELYFGLERRKHRFINVWPEPEFEVEEIGNRNGYLYYYDQDHVLCRVFVTGETTMPEHIEYPVKSRKDWEIVMKPRLNADTPGRYPENIADLLDDAITKGYIPWLFVGSMFGILRNWIGFKEICYMIYDAPDLLDEMIQHLADLTSEILERLLPVIPGKVIVANFWEDIAFKTGPMISPEYFNNNVIPRYKQIVDILHKNGVDTVIVDCDGWIGPLIEGWLDAGVNIMFPSERASGSDPVMLRKKYGCDLLLMGGVDKRKIAQGEDAIVRELEYLAPLVEEGGYIPFCDHRVPADVTLKNYRFYLEKKREIFNIPHREERIRKYPSD